MKIELVWYDGVNKSEGFHSLEDAMYFVKLLVEQGACLQFHLHWWGN